MTPRAFYFFWLFSILAGLGILWVFSGILAPFVCGMIAAYLLDPLVARLSQTRLKRQGAVAVILGGFLTFLLIVFAVTIPFVMSQIASLMNALPDIVARVETVLDPYIPGLDGLFSTLSIDQGVTFLKSHGSESAGLAGVLATGLMTSGQAALSFIAFIAIMPIVAFYMLTEWPRIRTFITGLLPRAQVTYISGVAAQIDTRISAFIRGQLIVCALLAVYYGVGLSLVGLEYGFAIGFLAGVLSIIPFVGSIFGLVAATLVALFQVPVDGWSILLMALAIFAVGQFAEGNFITPRIVGSRVGLHPLWIIFALMAGGALMGFVGLLVAVPVAASLAVLINEALHAYKASSYYTGSKRP